MGRCAWLAAFLLAVNVCCDVRQAGGQVTLGQVDTFQSIDASGWSIGLNGSSFPTVMSSGGPGGANDAYLQNSSIGGTGANGAQIILNPVPAVWQGGSQSQWTGNYIAAGVTTITAEMKNFGSSDLFMRVALQDSTGNHYYASTIADPLPADGNWRLLSFDLTQSGLTAVDAPGFTSVPYTQVLSAVGQLRILDAQSAPKYKGDTVVSTMGIADITAAPEPGALLPLVVSLVLCRRRMRA